MAWKELLYFHSIRSIAVQHQAQVLMLFTSTTKIGAIYVYYYDYHKFNNKPCRQLPDGIKFSVIDRWGSHPLLAKTFADLIRKELKSISEENRSHAVILFSAHSLPLKVIKMTTIHNVN